MTEKYHLGEVLRGHGPGAETRWNPVRMDFGQAENISGEYNRVAEDGQPRVVIMACLRSFCCVPEDADITGRGLVFVDVLGRGLEPPVPG